MAQRPQPSLRFADGGSFITRWAQSVMRPDATAKRLREIEAPPPPPPPVPAPAPAPAPNPYVTKDNPAGIRFQDGGSVPGSGRGDKIPAKYEPGEFVVSNDMIDDNPGLREQLSGLRADTLAARGKTVEEADAKALRYHGGLRGGEHGQESTQRSDAFSGGSPQRKGTSVYVGAEMDGGLAGDSPGGAGTRGTDLPPGGRPQVSLRAVDGFDPLDRMARNLTGQNSLPPKSPVGNMADDLARNARATPPPFDATRNFAPPPSSMPAGPSSNSPRQFNVPPSSMPAGPSSSLAGGAAGVAAEAAYGERVNPTLKPNNPAFYGDGRFGAPASAPATAAPTTQAAPPARGGFRGAIDGTKGFLGGAGASAGSVGGALKSVGGGALSLAKGAIASPLGVGLAAGQTVYDGFNTDTEQYARRFGLENTEPGFARDLGVRALGVASDAGNALTFGLAKKFLYRDDSDPAAAVPDTLRKSAPYANAAPPNSGPQPPTAGAASPTADPGAPRRVDRPGQSPLFTNVADDAPYIGNNALMARGNGPNAQNMRGADNLAATDSLRSQGAALSGQSGSPGVPAMPQTLHSGNSWEARNNLRNLAVSASSIYNNQSAWGDRAKGAADIAAFHNAQQADTAARTGSDPGSVARTTAQANMFGSKATADASKETSRNSLRGTMYTADSQLGGKQMESQQKLRQQQMMGGIYQAAGGDPVKAAKLAASYGIDGKQFTDMAAADQTRAQANVKDARSTFENMFTRDGKDGPERDANAEAMANQLADQIAPGYSRMSVEERAAVRPKIIEATRMVQGMNTLRNSTWSQKVGVDDPTPAYSQMPDLNGAQVDGVGWLEGAAKADVGRGDTKITLRDGTVRYLPKGQRTEAQERILEENGAKRAK